MVNIPLSPLTADTFVLKEVSEPKVIAVLRSKRLLYARRLFRSDQALLLQLILLAGSGTGTWLAALITDFSWMKTVLAHKLTELPCPEEDLHPWIKLTTCSSWRNLVKCATERDILFVQPSQPKHVSDEHQCSDCGKQFSSYPELQGHRHRVHGYKNPLRGYMPTSTCLCCLKQFASRPRLLCHLQHKSNRCAGDLVKHFKPLDREMSDILDRHDLATAQSSPCRQQAGPSLVGSVPRDRYLTVEDLPEVVRASLST